MNQDLQDLEIKVENEGTTPQGRLTATEWNILVAAVKSLDLTGGSVDITSILQAVADAGYATREWVNNQDYATTTDFNKFVKDFVTLNTTQAISGIKDFTNGLKVGGLSVYKSQADTIYLDANLVVRGGVTAFGTKETITDSIFEALPIDGAKLKRTENGVLYVDTTVVGGGGGTGGGISIADVENYLTTNGYATQSWVTGKGYITGINASMVTNALGYTPYNSSNPAGYITSSGSITGNAATATKLATTRSIWGQSFDGSTDVSGNIFPINTSGCYYNENGISYHTNKQYQASILRVTSSYNVAIGGTTATEKLHVYGNILATGGITAPTFTGVASNATYWNAPSSIRPTTANVPVVGNTTFSHFLATSSMTTGKPSNDGYIIHGEWDTVAGWSSQLFLANGTPDANNRMQWRAMDSGTWGEWKSVAFIDTGILKPTQGLQINHIGSNYAEGIRLANRNGISNTWSEINFGCDPSATTGTHETQWTVGRNGNNNYFVVRNFGTDYLQIDLSGNTLIKGTLTMNYSSDRRLKRNIRKVNASKVLMSLGAVWAYEYVDSEVQKNHIYEGTHYGLIYQHVKGTKLDVMCHEREDKMGALNYISTDFISIVAGATMENISEIEKLKRENRRLKKRVEQLEKRVA